MRILATALLLSSVALAASQTPAFTVEKFDIKGDGGTDYVAVEAATGRVFVSRATHMMVVEGATGKVLFDIPNTPGVHGAGIATKAGHVFTTNGGDQTVSMVDLKTYDEVKRIKIGPGLDGIMYDEPDDKIILTNHSNPGTLTALDPASGDVVATVTLEDNGPEGAAADGKGHIFVNNENKSTIQVVDVKTWKATASWPLAPCEGPTGIAYDKASNRIFAGCPGTSVVVDATTGKVVASIKNGGRVDALGWDPAKEARLHPERPGRQRHGRAPGFRGHLQRRRDGDYGPRRQDDLRGPEHTQGCICSSRNADRPRRPPPARRHPPAAAACRARSSRRGSSQ